MQRVNHSIELLLEYLAMGNEFDHKDVDCVWMTFGEYYFKVQEAPFYSSQTIRAEDFIKPSGHKIKKKNNSVDFIRRTTQ